MSILGVHPHKNLPHAPQLAINDFYLAIIIVQHGWQFDLYHGKYGSPIGLTKERLISHTPLQYDTLSHISRPVKSSKLII